MGVAGGGCVKTRWQSLTFGWREAAGQQHLGPWWVFSGRSFAPLFNDLWRLLVCGFEGLAKPPQVSCVASASWPTGAHF